MQGLKEENTLDYFPSVPVMRKTKLITLAPSINVIKCPSYLTNGTKQCYITVG